MQTVSQGWKDNQNELLVSESFVDVSLSLLDPDAYESATASDNGHASISNTAQTISEVDKNIKPYATLEKNLWVLDGGCEVIPTGTKGDCGFISGQISGGDAVFTSPPILTLSFPEVQHNLIQGVTIEWGVAFDEYAVNFAVVAYNGDTPVATKIITGNTELKSVVFVDIEGYDRIDIRITKWCLPHRRARIANILPGVEISYSKKDIFSFSHSQDVDPISSTLPKSEISFSLDNLDGSYNPNNLDSLSKYLIERQELKARYGYKIDGKTEWIKCGTFYMSEWSAKQNGMSADFKARDLLEFMTDTYFKGLYYPNGVSLYDLAVDVLTDANLPLQKDGSTKWYVDERLKDIYTVAPLPIDTHANCLQLIANAGECVLYQDRNGTLRMEKVAIDSETTDYNINYFNSYSKPDLTLSKPLKQVRVPCYSYSVDEVRTELYKEVMTVNGTIDLMVTYSSSAENVTTNVAGGTLNSATYYSNMCLLNLTANGVITVGVKGYPINSSTIDVTTNSGVSGETISVDNPLITNRDRAIAVGAWVENYMKNRKIINVDWRADPRLDALDVVSNENDYDVNSVVMTNVNYSYNGAFRGKGEGRVI